MADAVYCGRCGQRLERTCPACGAGPLQPDLAFCTACGTPLGQPAALERKVVTVVFVDVVGFTSLAERLDPEDVRRLLDPYYVCAREHLERFGGTVEKFIGDAVMSLFGAPAVREDDAERAVRGACAVRDAVANLHADDSSPPLRVRIGIATGEAVVAVNVRPEQGEAMAHGDVVNTASRLQSGAPVDGIVVDERTYRATRDQIDFRAEPPLSAKGKAEPVPVWSVLAPRARTGTDRFRHRRALVGRRREIEALAGLVDRMIARGEPQMITLVGPPGIGKSRLTWELFQRVDRRPELIIWRHGRSLPYGDGVIYSALAEIVKAHAGILATDPAAAVEQKLRTAVENAVPAGDARWVEGHLAPLAGVAVARDLRGDHRTEAFAAWRRFLEGIAARRPLVLVFEDLHWADDGMLEFVSDHLGERFAGPLVVVATCRPELLDRRPGWAAKPTLALQPLSDADTAHLVADLLEAPDLPAELRTALVASAAGNPLYAEEYVRLLLDRGLLRADGATLELGAAALPLPESVQAIVAARLDALAPEEKRLVQDAAVVGRLFWPGALAAVGGQPRWAVDHHLHELERTQLVRRELDTIVLSEPQHSFSHAIVRDVAYEQIPRSARAEKHRRAAEWLEALSPERSKDRAELLAHHYLSALRYVRPSEPLREALLEPARVALGEAGDRSLSLNAFAKAALFYSEALALWPAEAPGREDLVFRLGSARAHAESSGADLLAEARDTFLETGQAERAAEAMVLIGELLWMQGDPDAFDHLEQAAELLRPAPPSPSKAHVLCSLARFGEVIRNEHQEAIAIGLQALAMADELGISELRAHALDSIGLARARSGDPRGIADLERSIAIAAADNSPECLRGYANLGNALVEAGHLGRAFDLYEEGRAAAGRFGDADRIRWFEVERMYQDYWAGRWDDALRIADDVAGQAEAGFPTAFEQDARLVRGRIRLARDQPGPALDDSARALDLGQRSGYPEMLVPALALRARVLEATGSAGDAAVQADRLLEVWPARCPASYWIADLAVALHGLRSSARLLAALAGTRSASLWIEAARAVGTGDFAAAAAVYARVGSLPDEALARLVGARDARDAGRGEQPAAELAAALAAFRRVDATRYVREAERLLALPA